MLAALAPMKRVVSANKFHSHSESFISLLHTKLTAIILLTFSVILSTKQLIGEPIACVSDQDIPARVINSWCWMNNTFTIPENRRLIKPFGIGPVTENGTVKYHAYYQWVCVVLFMQGIFFYFPRYLWKMFENDVIVNLSKGLHSPLVESAIKEEKIQSLVMYFRTSGLHRQVFTLKYLLCEVLNFVNVLAQIWFIDYFLDGAFTKYGYSFKLLFNPDPKSYQRIESIFPKMTKCTFFKYGPSGTIVNRDALCILPLNVFNEKIYIFIWYWFIILAIVGAMQLILRFVAMLSVHTRYLLMEIDTITLKINAQIVKILVRDLNYYDLFVLSKLRRNMNPTMYKELLILLSEKYRH